VPDHISGIRLGKPDPDPRLPQGAYQPPVASVVDSLHKLLLLAYNPGEKVKRRTYSINRKVPAIIEYVAVATAPRFQQK
jgi:hypothetical protein